MKSDKSDRILTFCYILNIVKRDLKKPHLIKDLEEDFLKSPILIRLIGDLKKMEPTLEVVRKYVQDTKDKLMEEYNNAKMDFPSLINDRPIEHYILDEVRQLKKNTFTTGNQNQVVIKYRTEDSILERNIDGKIFVCNLTNDSKRVKMLNILLSKKKFNTTEELRHKLDCPSDQAVSKIAKTLNSHIEGSLKINDIKIIEGKKGSGYRISPQIVILKM